MMKEKLQIEVCMSLRKTIFGRTAVKLCFLTQSHGKEYTVCQVISDSTAKVNCVMMY